MLAGYHSGTIWALAAEYVSGAAWGRMLHIGCECWDGASVSLTQLSNASVQCSPSFHPSIPPPPLSSSNKWSFCSSVFAAVGWRASAGPSPETSGLSWNSFLLHSIICGLSVSLSWFFSCLIFFLIAVFVSFLFDYSSSTHSSQSLSSSDVKADGFLKFLPSLLFTTLTVVRHFFTKTLSCLNAFRPPPCSHCVSRHPLNACRDT